MTRPPSHLVVGHVSKPHGTRGEVLVWVLTDHPDRVYTAGRRLVLGTESGEVEAGGSELEIEATRPFKKGVLVRIAGVADRNEAEELVGRYLLVPADELGDPEPGEVYYHQLLGLRVETADGETVGRVREVFETSPSHLLEVKGADRVHLIPFSREIVRSVDVEEGRLVIEPPEGLLDL